MATWTYETMRAGIKPALSDEDVRKKLALWSKRGMGLFDECHVGYQRDEAWAEQTNRLCLAFALCEQGREEFLWPLLENLNDPEVRKKAACRGQSLLHLAVCADNPVAVKELVRLGWPVEEDTHQKGSPLAWAVKLAKPLAAQALVESGASWTKPTTLKNTIDTIKVKHGTEGVIGDVQTFPWAMALTQPNIKILKLALDSVEKPTRKEWVEGKTARLGSLSVSVPTSQALENVLETRYSFDKGWWRTLVDSGAYEAWWSDDERKRAENKIKNEPDRFAYAYQALEKKFVGKSPEEELKHSQALMSQNASIAVLSKWFNAARAKAYWVQEEKNFEASSKKVTEHPWVELALMRPSVSLLMKDALTLEKQAVFWRALSSRLAEIDANDQSRIRSLHDTQLDTLETPMKNVFQMHASTDEKVVGWQNRILWTLMTQPKARTLYQWRSLLNWALETKRIKPSELLETLTSSTLEGRWYREKEYLGWIHEVERSSLKKHVTSAPAAEKKQEVAKPPAL